MMRREPVRRQARVMLARAVPDVRLPAVVRIDAARARASAGRA